eukprot:9477210-Pyramimonas_sp.AAC.1
MDLRRSRWAAKWAAPDLNAAWQRVESAFQRGRASAKKRIPPCAHPGAPLRGFAADPNPDW